jgi:predicted phage baseplate assembly protein
LPGELIEVREWSGRGDDWETAVEGVPRSDLRFEVDPRDAQTKTAVWVKWHGRAHLYASNENDRHYVIERASGTVRFGGNAFGSNGYGMIPPAGARIVASFATGGGLRGNVAPGTITELRSGVGYVESVVNPLGATGGVETELAVVARERATHRLRHRSRAVSASDYEWLAYEATPEVARARALPLLGPAGLGERGSVSLVIVPQSVAPSPTPTLELTRRVIAHLRANAPAGIGERIRIVPPTYVRVSIRAEIVPLVPEDAALVESRVREALDRFLHPLTGNTDGSGWNFGDSVYLSSIAVLVESTVGLDYVRFLQLKVGDARYADWVPVEPGSLIAAGDHQLKLMVGGSAHAVA